MMLAVGIPLLTACRDSPTAPVVGVVSGTVTVAGSGISGVRVSLAATRTALTEASGTYTFSDVPEGVHLVRLEVFPDSLRFERLEQTVTIGRSTPAVSANFSGRIPLPGTLSGRVSFSDGSGIASVDVRLNKGSDRRTGLTDGGGGYAFSALSVGTWSLDIAFPTGVEGEGASNATVSIGEGSAVTQNFRGRKIRAVEEEIRPGRSDTLAVAGAMLAVDASLTVPLDVKLELGDTSGWGGLLPLGTPVVLSITRGSSPLGVPTRTSHDGSSSKPLRLLVDRGPGAAEDRLNVKVGEGAEALTFSVAARGTQVVDPKTGVRREMLLVDLPVPGSGQSMKATFAAKLAASTCNAHRITPHPTFGSNTGGIPLILVHGWQLKDNDCESATAFDPAETWEDFLDFFAALPPNVRNAYRVMLVRYPTYESVGASSAWLSDQIENLSGAVILAHSMGGLVGRGVLASITDLSKMRALITLGTPHLGSPLANFTDEELFADEIDDACSIPGWLKVARSAGFRLEESEGFRDLQPTSEFIKGIANRMEDGPRIYTFGGLTVERAAIGQKDAERIFEGTKDATMEYLGCAMRQLVDDVGASDGVVPRASAVPEWTAVQRTFAGVNHIRLPEDPQVLADVGVALRSLVDCSPAPTPPAKNDFTFSASVARRNNTEIDATVNAVIVDGKPADLTASNFTVIEDGCIRKFALTTGQGSVGIDIAFVQDLSSSMSDAVSGVRTSVINFANALVTQGLDVRFGAIGYSGPGTIPSSPATSTCEYLGPGHAFSSAAAFQLHVASSWRVTAGCDNPENGLEALEWAHRNLGWRAGAVRVYIDVTDVSHHTRTTNCNGRGPCTDHNLASITALLGPAATVHVVAPSSSQSRTSEGGLDPWLLADATGGVKLVLVRTGFDLTSVGIGTILQKTSRLTFTSTTAGKAAHHLRIRVTTGGRVAELAPGVAQYAPQDPSLSRPPP